MPTEETNSNWGIHCTQPYRHLLVCKTLEGCYSVSNGHAAFRLGQFASVSELFCTIYETQQFQTIFPMSSLDALYSKKRMILKKLPEHIQVWGLYFKDVGAIAIWSCGCHGRWGVWWGSRGEITKVLESYSGAGSSESNRGDLVGQTATTRLRNAS